MGSTYVMGHGGFVPASSFAAKGSFTTLPFGEAGGWEPARTSPVIPGGQFRHSPPIFGLGPVQGLGQLGHAPIQMQTYGLGFAGLGIAPLVVGGTLAAGAAIGGLAALVQNALADDWSDSEVFTSHARAIHSAMLAMQCLFGGAQKGSPIVDTLGNQICKGGTKPSCTLTGAQLVEWRALRDGFAKFWAGVSDSWTSFGPTNAQARTLKDYASQFNNFYMKVASTCAKQGTQLPGIPPFLQQDAPVPEPSTPGWLKWTVVGIGFVSVVFVARLFLPRG